MSGSAIAILGGGHMGKALASGLIARGAEPASIAVGEADASRRTALATELGLCVHADNAAAIASASAVIVAIKPQDIEAALAPLRGLLTRTRPLVLSVVAGVRCRTLQRVCGTGVPVVRAMPNRPALVGAGVTGLFAPESVEAERRAAAERLMQALGEIVWLREEDHLDVVTALSGSGPAYFFLLAELMMDAAVDLGLEPQAARTLAMETLVGSGHLARASDGDLARLRAEVTSPGGTTEAALRVYGGADLRAIVARALAAATQRSRELAREAEKNHKPR